MKKVLFVLALMACMLSCRSVKNFGNVERHHYSRDADTLVAVSKMERADSSSYYRLKADSLSNELYRIKQDYKSLYVRDSINEVLHSKDSVSIKDTTWMQVNQDGSVTYHNYREKNTYSWKQFERHMQQIKKESQAVIDSLIERNECLQTKYDSISRYQSLIDSASVYKARLDSLSNAISEHEQTTIVKNGILDKAKSLLMIAGFLLLVYAAVDFYMRYFKR
jgi:hypothetical protein